MAPKKTIAEQLRARLSPASGNSEEGGDDEQGDLEPQQNQQGSTKFDTIVGTPSRKDKILPMAPLRQNLIVLQ